MNKTNSSFHGAHNLMDNSDNRELKRNAKCQEDTNALMKTTDRKGWLEVCTGRGFMLDGEGRGKPFPWGMS